MIITSLHLKTAVMAYYRFKKQSICADECGMNSADVLIDTGKEVIEVETKTSKQDLKRDSLKPKHQDYKTVSRPGNVPNKFFVCVPTNLLEAAKEWVEQTNPSYGIYEFIIDRAEVNGHRPRVWEDMVRTIRKAKPLQKEYYTRKHVIGMRSCSANINLNIALINRMKQDDKTM